jgi:sugar-phosphatase
MIRDNLNSFRDFASFAACPVICETDVMPLFSCEAILFDLDGVLVDSTPCVTRVWSNWARQHGLDPEYIVHVAHGQRTIETVRIVAPSLDPQGETNRIEQMELDDTDGLRVLPGAAELLGKIPPERYTIVTSGTRRLATKRLEVAGLPVPAKMITADDVTRGKPDPEPYLAGARALGFQPSLSLVLEDAPSGIRAAKSAGMTVMAVLTTFGARDLAEADVIIASLQDVQATGEGSGRLALTLQTVV